ncbi:MAG: DUF4150 domain-containing protein [Polyangiaceae bacterium]|nr:DUF4150 domain-containing protein [Polyangiaceae bacterium]
MSGAKMGVGTTKKSKCVTPTNVCFVPAPPPVQQVPMVMGSIGELPTATGTCDKVLVEHKPTVVFGSKMKSSKGDDPGTKKGMISSTQGKDVTPKEFSSTVYFGGKKVFLHTGKAAHNGSNPNQPMGMFVEPSTDKVVAGA